MKLGRQTSPERSAGYVKGIRGRTTVHGEKGSPTHNSWRSMMGRCYTPSDTSYRHYGAIGIRVCERWWSFINFKSDMGLRPAGMSLDRWPNKNGNYEPGNCRWATRIQQGNNTRDNIVLTARGKTQTICEWARQQSVPRGRIYNRIFRYRWSVEDAIFNPKLPRGWIHGRCL
jgi:hypothetical protein